MKNIIKSILVIALILITIALIFGNNTGFISKTKNLAISELVTLINKGEISQIEIKENNVVSIDKSNNKITTKINVNESIFEVLKYYNVDATKLENVKIVFKEDIN